MTCVDITNGSIHFAIYFEVLAVTLFPNRPLFKLLMNAAINPRPAGGGGGGPKGPPCDFSQIAPEVLGILL